jgi:hypothetical protein
MLAIIVSIAVGISILLSAFTAFTPGFQEVMEKDFLRRANSNAFLYSMQQGQLSVRAGTMDSDPLTPAPNNTELDIDLRTRASGPNNWLHSDITVTKDTSGIDRINADICQDQDACP